MLKNNKTLNTFQNLKDIDLYIIYDNSYKNSDLFYVTEFKSEDPFFYMITKNNEELILISDMEKNRAINESRVKNIITYSELNYFELSRKYGYIISIIYILERLFTSYSAKKIGISDSFPLKYYTLLTRKNSQFIYKVVNSPIKDMRAIKNKYEIKYISESIKAAESGMRASINYLKKCTYDNDYIYYNNKIVTGNKILSIIDKKLLEKGCYGINTIVSGGKDTENPHGNTNGILESNKPIIIDIFPRNRFSLYYGDMTRTVIVGKASYKLKNIYDTVKKSQLEAIKLIRPGISFLDIHNKACEIIEDDGYKTLKSGSKTGFIHSIGHGVGLDVHEFPFVFNDSVLQEGNIITVEPGIYCPSIGGIRLEDTVLVTKSGYKNLNKYEKVFEI